MKKNQVVAYLLIIFCFFCFAFITPTIAAAENTNSMLSSDELEYLQEKKTLKVSVILDRKPFSYMEKDNTYQGLPVTILNRLSEESGISLEFIPARNYNRSLHDLTSGKVDMIAMLTNYLGDEQYTQLPSLKSVSYLKAQAMLIKHKNTDLSSLSMATLADIKGMPSLTRNKNVAVIYYNSPEECFNAVRCKQADAALCDTFTISSMMQQYSSKDLVSMPSAINLDFGFGFLPETDSRLISALQKTTDSFSPEDITRSLMAGNAQSNGGFLEFVYTYPFEIICFVFSIMFVLALILVTYTKIKLRHHQSLQGYEESYRLLSDTFGEAGLEYDYLNDSLTIFGKHSNLDIDQKVDDFKENLQNKAIRLSLTPSEFENIINANVENQSFTAEFQCGVKSGEWVWYQLIYTVICTSESHKRPIRLVGCLVNVDAEHAEKERLMKLSSNDQLTGIYNHATAEKLIRKLFEQEPKSHNGMLVILDIDYFKNFNDRMGHLCGDMILRTLGETVNQIFSDNDILSRWGGDEFLFFLTDKNGNSGEFAKKIKILQEKMANNYYRDVACPVTLSIGGAKTYPECNFDILFQQADDALYLAKENGRDQFWLYSPTEQKPNQSENKGANNEA